MVLGLCLKMSMMSKTRFSRTEMKGQQPDEAKVIEMTSNWDGYIRRTISSGRINDKYQPKNDRDASLLVFVYTVGILLPCMVNDVVYCRGLKNASEIIQVWGTRWTIGYDTFNRRANEYKLRTHSWEPFFGTATPQVGLRK